MKFVKWRVLIITCIVCILPIFLGLALWGELPEEIAIHFDLYNKPDNFASRGFVVFFFPFLMAVLQIICCLTNDFNAHRNGGCKKLEAWAKWIIPVMSIILHIVTFCYALGWEVDIRRIAILVVSAELIVIGNYLPKYDRIKNYDIDSEKAKKINRFVGFETVIMGLLMLVTIFLPPIATLIWLFLIIPYALIGVIYGIKVARTDIHRNKL